MLLRRIGDGHEQRRDDLRAWGDEPIQQLFFGFGYGGRTSDFSVAFEWQDVEDLIAAFATQANPAALRIQQALRLADAVQGLKLPS